MKQLTCEMCGSTDLIKQDGVFVCQLCGTKYSVEEAKKMMIEGVVEISGTVKIDDTDKASTYISMAENACAAGNYAEAESYCNKVIEIEPENYKAWILKGKAAGWQSSLSNIRLGESLYCFSNALRFATSVSQDDGDDLDVIRERIIGESKEEIEKMIASLINHQGGEFNRHINSEEKNNMIRVVDAIVHVFSTTRITFISLDDIAPVIKKSIYETVMNTWENNVFAVYKANGAHPSAKIAEDFFSYTRPCEELLSYAITLSKNNDNTDIMLYNSIIKTSKAFINCKGYRPEPDLTNPDPFAVRFDVRCCATDSEIKRRNGLIAQYSNKIEQCNKNIREKKQREDAEKRKKQNQEYWNNHTEEKKQLESERDSLQSQLAQLQDQFAPYEKEINSWKKKREAETPSNEEKKTVKKQIADLEQQKSNLGMFKGKEKKSLQAQIDELNSRLPRIEESIVAEEKEQRAQCNAKISEIEQTSNPIKQKIEQSQNRINEITTELTKDR